MKFLRALAAGLLLGTAAIGFAQDQMPGPPEEVKKLAWMVGTWTGKMKWSQPGMEMDMDQTMTCDMVGNFLRCVTKTVAGGFTMEEYGYIGWDPAKKKYSSHTFTNIAPTPRVEWGVVAGNTMVFESEPWVAMGAEAIIGRGTLTRKGDDECVLILEFKEGAKWTKVAEGTFKKKK